VASPAASYFDPSPHRSRLRDDNAQRHRGPDDEGMWSQESRQERAGRAAGIVFGHRRLAIVDLSPAGHHR